MRQRQAKSARAEQVIGQAIHALEALGLPKAQRNDRSGLTLLALLDLTPDKNWADAGRPLLGVTPIMDWVREHYDQDYRPNTRETVRRQTLHQFAQAGLVQINPDRPERPTNSPKTVYQIAPEALSLLQSYGGSTWEKRLETYLSLAPSLAVKYSQPRSKAKVQVCIAEGQSIDLTPGDHNELIRAIVEEFAPRFAKGGTLLYVGDTGQKFAYFAEELCVELGIAVDAHGKMPDVVIHLEQDKWLIVVEAVTSHDPVNPKRKQELNEMLGDARSGLIFVTAFMSRSEMVKHLNDIAWETEVWVAEAPDHLIHFDGERFLGPYGTNSECE